MGPRGEPDTKTQLSESVSSRVMGYEKLATEAVDSSGIQGKGEDSPLDTRQVQHCETESAQSLMLK
jgi:hypothetical protein